MSFLLTAVFAGARLPAQEPAQENITNDATAVTAAVRKELQNVSEGGGLLKDENLLEAAVTLLHVNYGIAKEGIVEYLTASEMSLSKLEALRDPGVRSVFGWLDTIRTREQILYFPLPPVTYLEPAFLLDRSIAIGDLEVLQRIFDRVETLGISPYHWIPADPLSALAARDPLFVQTLMEDDFERFLHRIAEVYGAKPENVGELYDCAEIFARDRDGCMKALQSGGFAEVMKALREDYKLKTLPLSCLRGALALTKGFDRNRIKLITELVAQEEKHGLQLADLVLCQTVTADARLSDLFSDRAKLEETVARYLRSSPPVVRREGRKPSRFGPYSEQPDVAELSRLDLLRVLILHEAFRTEGFQQALGCALRADLKDSGTEHGGYIALREGKAELAVEASIAPENTAYCSASSKDKLYPGLAALHFHATAFDNSLYAGPSWPDLISSRESKVPGVVITALGKAEGEGDGLRVNMDLYFWSDSERYHVVDLGEVTVSLASGR